MPAVTSVSFSGKRRVCFIDDADKMAKTAQDILSKVVEDTAANCRFIMAANDQAKLIAPVMSRLAFIPFYVRPDDRERVIARMIARYEQTLTAHGLEFDPEGLRKIVRFHFPDLRAAAIKVETEFGHRWGQEYAGTTAV